MATSLSTASAVPAASAADTVVVLDQTSGIALIPKPTALTRLNYYDGKFLRAADMQAEQDYHRRAQQLAAQAAGVGVAYGFDLRLLAGDQVELAAGLAVAPQGELLFMPQEAAVQIEDLIARSSATAVVQAAGSGSGTSVFALCDSATATPTTPVVAGTALYVLGISHAEALCGQEDVFGKLCEEACVSGTERPQRLEGVVLRALPLQLASPLPVSSAVTLQPLHLRSRVAAACFADEALQTASLISGSGLLSSLWCSGAAPSVGSFVPLAVLARAGGHTVFMDGWTARRERIDATPRRYWQWRMMMRPWDVFLAQVLQFQCQLRDAWQTAGSSGGDDPCDTLRRAVQQVGDLLAQLDRQYRETSARLAAVPPAQFTPPPSQAYAQAASAAPGPTASTASISTAGTTASLNAAGAVTTGSVDGASLSATLLASAIDTVSKAQQGAAPTALLTDRVLIGRGIVELPSAGYLPVAPGSAISVNDQVRRLMGEGVDLRFCVCRPDEVALALEAAQHMQRISLLSGLDNPKQLEEVDVLVPDGRILSQASAQGVGWEMRVSLAQPATGGQDPYRETSAASASNANSATSPYSAFGAASAAGASPAAAAASDGTRGDLSTVAYQRSVMSGAARSEALGDGSLGFFFAGLVETASYTPALAALKTWAAGRDNGLAETLWKSVALATAPASAAPAAAAASAQAPGAPAGAAQAAAPAAAAASASKADSASATTAADGVDAAGVVVTGPAPPTDLGSRYAALRQEAVAYRLKSMERTAVTGTRAGIRNFEGLSNAPDADHLALWLALRAQGNPLTAPEGSKVAMSLELSVIGPKAGGTRFVDLNIVGAKFAVESRVTTGQSLAVQGTLTGGAIIAGLVGSLASGQSGLQFSVPVLMRSRPTADGSEVLVEIDFGSLLYDSQGFVGLERLGVRVLTTQSIAPSAVPSGQKAQVQLSLAAQGVALDLVARLNRNDAVLQLGNPFRVASETAIDVLATGETAPQFASQARADLFGSPPAQQDALTIQATRDWVLFHRRRTRQCAAVAAPTSTEQRRFDLYHLRTQNDTQLRQARAAVMGANAALIGKLGFAPIAAVAFDGGRSTLATPTDALLADWKAAQPGSAIRFGGIGSQGAAQAEGDALAQARLASLELALNAGKLESGLENQVLQVLPALPLAGWDGAIFLITQDAAAACQEVYATGSADQLQSIANYASQNGLRAAITEFQLQPLAHVEFAADAKTLAASSVPVLTAAWGSSPPPDVLALVFYAGTSISPALASQQTAAIMTALGNQGRQVQALPSDQLAPGTACSAISVLVQAPLAQAAPRQVLVALTRDGVFIHDTSSGPFLVSFQNGSPSDPKAFNSALSQLMTHKPITLRTGVQNQADLAAAATIESTAETALAALGFTPNGGGGTGVLTSGQIAALANVGFAATSYEFVIALGLDQSPL